MRLSHSAIFRFGALVFLLQLAGSLALLLVVHQLTGRQIIADAQIKAEELRDELLAREEGGDLKALSARVRARQRASGNGDVVLLLADAQGRSLAGNIAQWPPSLPRHSGATTAELFRIASSEPEEMRLVSTRLPQGAYLLTGHVIENERRFTELLEEAMTSALAVALALGAFAAWSAARMLDRKVRTIVDTTEAVSAGDFNQRVPLQGSGDAFDALGLAINHMLERIGNLVSELKFATDGLAHDLRSPLTRLRSTLERALAAEEGEETRKAIARAMEEGDRLLAMLETALQISRAEAGLGRETFTETDVTDLVRDMAEVYGPVAEDLGIAITLDAPGTVRLPVHRELLAQAFANLIDNALKYGGQAIELSAHTTGEELVLAVADNGPGISEAERPVALRRFGKLDSARTRSGAGLGLALASVVARLHGGELVLADNEPGLRAQVRLPLHPPH
ncbi:MAG TPA: HAMP domain-containing sensor histidine kinase [Sphingomonadaceae bacterium]|nr:HAMP domain-containing sensor histidine kinase [Sphingomonadaceae bacterium]